MVGWSQSNEFDVENEVLWRMISTEGSLETLYLETSRPCQKSFYCSF